MTPAQQQAELLRTSEAIAYRAVIARGGRIRRPLLELLGLPDSGASKSNAETGRQHLRAALRIVEASGLVALRS